MNTEVILKPSLRVWNRIAESSLPLILFLSVLLRVAVALAMGNDVVELPGILTKFLSQSGIAVAGAWLLRSNVVADYTGGCPAHWSFLYTLYLALIYAIAGPQPIIARILQAIIVGILHPYIAYRIGEKLFTRTVGLVAAFITAVYVYFFYYGAALMTEPFYITAILFSLYFSMQLAESASKKQDVGLGIALGISIGVALLLRQVYLLFLPILFLWIWIARFQRSRNLPVLSTVLSFALIVLFILPVTLYNQSRLSFWFAQHKLRICIFLGESSDSWDKFIPIMSTSTYQDLIPEEMRHLNEAELDRELLRRGIQFVLDDPGRYILLSLSRIPPYFVFWYSSTSSTLSNLSRIASFGVMLPFMIYGLVLSIRKNATKKGNRLLNLLISAQGLLMASLQSYIRLFIFSPGRWSATGFRWMPY
jgi:4-amino-4-deoxy-L-arabinose transferase-like glycosyltransferase